MSTSACGEGGPNGAVGGLDDTSVPGAGECGAGKAYCKRYRRLAANGDFTGLAFVGEDKERPMKTLSVRNDGSLAKGGLNGGHRPPLPCSLPMEGFPYEFGPETER